MPRSSDIRSKSTRVNWTTQPHYQMHGGRKNRSGYNFKRGWADSVFNKFDTLKIQLGVFPGTSIRDVDAVHQNDQNDPDRWSDAFLHRPWLSARTDKFLLRGMHIGSKKDVQDQVIKNLRSIDNPNYDRNASPERRKQYEEARKFFLEEGGLKVSVGRTITGGHWNPLKWRRGLRGTKSLNRWRWEREAIVAQMARRDIRDATIAAYAKTGSVEFAKHVKEQMLAALLDKTNGTRELDKLFQCAKDAQWVDGSWQERDIQDLKNKFLKEKRGAAPSFFKLHDAVVYGDPSKLSEVVKDGDENTLNIIDKAADPSYYQMHGDLQGQHRYRAKAGWARSVLGKSLPLRQHTTFKKVEKNKFAVFFGKSRWSNLGLTTDKILQQEMEVGTPAEREQIRKNLNGILSGGMMLKSSKISKKQAQQNMEAFEFFFRQGGLKVRFGRTMTGNHWAPWNWRRGLRGNVNLNPIRTGREWGVAYLAEQRIREATIAAYAKTGSLDFTKHVKEQMLAALLEKKMDGRPLDRLFECSRNATWEKPKSWFSWKRSSEQRFANKYDVEKREAAPEFFNIYDAVMYGKPSELQKVAQGNQSDIKYDVSQSGSVSVHYNINHIKPPGPSKHRDSFTLSDLSDDTEDSSNESKSDIKKDIRAGDSYLKNAHVKNVSAKMSIVSVDSDNSNSEDKDSNKTGISVKDDSLNKSRARVDSSDKSSDNIIVEEERKPNKEQEKQEPSKNGPQHNLYDESQYKETDGLAQPEVIPPDGNAPTSNIQLDNDPNNALKLNKRRDSQEIEEIDDEDGKADILDDTKKVVVTIEDDGESSNNTLSSNADTHSSDTSIPNTTNLKKGEPSKLSNDLDENNNNNNDDKSAVNAGEAAKDKDGE